MLQNRDFIDNETVKQMKPEYQKLWNEVFECRNAIQNAMNLVPRVLNNSLLSEDADVTVAAFLLAKAFEFNDPFGVDLDTLVRTIDDEDISSLIKSCHIKEVWDRLAELLKKYEYRVFCLVSNLKNLSEPFGTPEGICRLAIEILKPDSKDVFADLCCGGGSVARAVCDACPGIKASGYDIMSDAIGLAKVRNAFSESEISFLRKDVFQLAAEEDDKPAFTKIFSNYPFGLNLKFLQVGEAFLGSLEKKIPSISKGTSSDWLFNALIMDLLDNRGKAVAVMSNGGTWNTLDAPVRKYFVEKGLIESVIALPAKLFGNTGIPVSLIVFSHGNEGIRLIDASKEFKAGRRVNELSEENIQVILQALKEDSDISRIVSLEELRDNEYVLSLGRYLHDANELENGVEFGDVMKRITRGAPLNAKDLDQMASAEPTEVQYLSISNVKDGLIDENLPYLKELDAKERKYCLTNHCLILSKNGYPYKIAVAEIKEGQTIMANGNLYLIELDEEKVDPYYLAAYLNSDQGIVALKSITVGVTIPNIGVEQLKNLMIPLPDMEEQRKIGKEYVKVRDEIALLQLKLERAKGRMSHIFEKGGE